MNEAADLAKALKIFSTAAREHEQEHACEEQETFCTDSRANLVAMLMVELNLQIENIGMIASHFLDIAADWEEPTKEVEEWPKVISD